MPETGSGASPAFIISRVPFRDNDLILGLMTRGDGPVSVIARSARNSRRRFFGVLDFFIVLDVVRSPGRGGLDVLVGAEPLRFFPGIHESLERLQAGQSILQAVRNVSRDAPFGPGMFDRLVESFGELEKAPSAAAHMILLETVFALSGELGHAPVDGKCPLCGLAKTAFSINGDGIFACRECCRPTGGCVCQVSFGQSLDAGLYERPVFTMAGGDPPGPADVSMIVEAVVAGITGHHSPGGGPDGDQPDEDKGQHRQGQHW